MTASIRPRAARAVLSILLTGCLLLTVAAPAIHAQTVANSSRQAVPADEVKVEQIRSDFLEMLERYPPSLGVLLKLDPSLMATDQYLAPYPAVAQFLAQHPEVRRNPAYYLEPIRSSVNSPYYADSSTRVVENMMDGIGVFAIMVTMLSALGWLIRTLVDYRRWGRLAKVQAEAHTKLLDRFTGNEELLAYVQSPAGSRFLQSAPISLDGGTRTMGAPLSRILWSLQAGVVLAAVGVGLNYVSGHVDPDVSQPIYAISVIAVSLGIGFIISAGLSFFLSRRMGLLGAPPDQREGSGA